MTVEVKVSGCTALAYCHWLASTLCINAKAIPTNDTDYSCRVKAEELVQSITMKFISCCITLLVNNNVVDPHMHTCKPTAI